MGAFIIRSLISSCPLLAIRLGAPTESTRSYGCNGANSGLGDTGLQYSVPTFPQRAQMLARPLDLHLRNDHFCPFLTFDVIIPTPHRLATACLLDQTADVVTVKSDNTFTQEEKRSKQSQFTRCKDGIGTCCWPCCSLGWIMSEFGEIDPTARTMR